MKTHKYSTYGTALNQGVCWKYEQDQIQQKVIQSKSETNDEKWEGKSLYTDIVIHSNEKRHDVRKEGSRVHVIKMNTYVWIYIAVMTTRTSGVVVIHLICEVS